MTVSPEANAASSLSGQNNDGVNAADAEAPPPPPFGEISPENEEAPPNAANENFTLAATARTAAAAGPAGDNGRRLLLNKCRLCPHGVYVVTPSIFAIMGWFAYLSKDGCDYARVTGPIVAEITDDPDVPFVDVGINNLYRVPELVAGKYTIDRFVPCQYDNTDVMNIDAVWTFSKITSFLSSVLGGAGALFIWFSTCFVFTRGTWRWAGYELLAAVSLLALTYSWFGTGLCQQNKCDMQYGAQVDIVTCVLWAASALFVFCKYPNVRKIGRDARDQSNAARPPVEVEMSNPATDREIT